MFALILRLSMYYNLSIEDQIKRILNKNNLFINADVEPNNDDNLICDIVNGKIYKSLLQDDVGRLIKAKKAFTLTLNTDGISVSMKSRITIWPIYLILNELPVDKRFCIDNVIIAGK